ncbi:MAG: hypothetical protein QOD83_434 [Solirubrobacteraceae bacterium]|jgi:hypothetical protein|nr:hypothetical protein [Solirubrobacteraceae bacterium]
MSGWVGAQTGHAFCGAIVECIDRPDPALDDVAAPHEQGSLVAPESEVVQWHGHAVPLPPMAASLRVCERRGVHERAALIHAAMRAG